MPTLTQKTDRTQGLKDWLESISQLEHQVDSWSQSQQWLVHHETKSLNEVSLGAYEAPVLTIQTSHGTLRLEPIGMDVAAADGRVDLYSFPGFQRVLLIREKGRWIVRTDSGLEWPRKWNQATFLDLAQKLTAS